LKCISKAKSAQKVTAKVSEKSTGFSWTVLDEAELWLRRASVVPALGDKLPTSVAAKIPDIQVSFRDTHS